MSRRSQLICALAVLPSLLTLRCERNTASEQGAPAATRPAPASTPAPSGPKTTHTKQELRLEGPEPRMRAHLSPQWDEESQLSDGIGLAPGSKLPKRSLQDIHGRQFTLRGLAEQGPLGVLFYRGSWCPYANYQLRAIAARGYHFANLGAKLVVVSVEDPKTMRRTQRQHGLGQMGLDVYLVSDPELRLHRAFNVVDELEQAEIAALEKKGEAVDPQLATAGKQLANPAFFVVDEQGSVRFANAHDNPEILIAGVQIVKVLRELFAAQ